MPKGVKITDIAEGTGETAGPGSTVVVTLSIFLNKGDEVTAEYQPDSRTLIDLAKRETIPGLRYGIVGMREGGRRTLRISPHLAYGAEGLGEFIPPNAVLRCEVGLLEVRAPGERKPGDFPEERQLVIFMSGEISSGRPRRQVVMEETGCCGSLITDPGRSGSWRHAIMKHTGFTIPADQAAALLVEAMTLPDLHPADCLSNDQLWSDSSEAGNGITRDRVSDTKCATISVYERGELIRHYCLKEDSTLWLESLMRRSLPPL